MFFTLDFLLMIEIIFLLQGQIVCEGPNNRLYDFVGNIRVDNQE